MILNVLPDLKFKKSLNSPTSLSRNSLDDNRSNGSFPSGKEHFKRKSHIFNNLMKSKKFNLNSETLENFNNQKFLKYTHSEKIEVYFLLILKIKFYI